MKALSFNQVNSSKIVNIPKPEVKNDEVLIKVKAAGICYSDISAYKGEHAFRKPPVISGHEFSGIIVEKGISIKKLNIGDRVIVEPHIGCGSCFFCKHGQYHQCLKKRFIGTKEWPGAFSEYVIAKEAMCYIMPTKMSFEEAAIIEPYCVGLHAVRRAETKIGDSIAILGCGTIGITTLMGVNLTGFHNILITDISEKKRKFALQSGADLSVDPKKENLERISNLYTNNLGFDIVFVAAPSNEVLKQAFRICRRQGKIIMISSFPSEVCFDASELRIRERFLIGTSMYTSDDYCLAIDQWLKKSLNLKSLITQKIQLEQTPEIIEKLANHILPDDIKTIIFFD
ncbi:MAG: zinc-dependent alcohol dehydrogenase [Eubacteriaceae bacterium]